MKRFFIAAVLLFMVLAGCVALPARQPWQSPLTFSSPLRLQQRHAYFLPLLLRGPQQKKGISLACGYEDMARMADEVETLRVAWVWNWGVDPPLFPDVESVPSIWSGASIGTPLGGNSEWLLGFNEPDMRDQANMSPAQAAREWQRLEDTYPDRKLASPQVVAPVRWLEEWYDAYQAQNDGRLPQIDAIAIHTYYDNDLESYKRQVEYYIDLAKRWGVPEIWITEFTIAPALDRTLRESIDDQRAYLKWLEAQPMVTRYAAWTNRVECLDIIQPNGIFDTPMIAPNGMLTEMGKMYSDFVGTIGAEW
jgi:hypothetical protein